MKYKLLILIIITALTSCGKPKPAQSSLNVEIVMGGKVIGTLTNVIQIIPSHEPNCHLIRSVTKGTTNEFHAFMAEVRDSSTHKIICPGPTQAEIDAVMKEAKEAIDAKTNAPAPVKTNTSTVLTNATAYVIGGTNINSTNHVADIELAVTNVVVPAVELVIVNNQFCWATKTRHNEDWFRKPVEVFEVHDIAGTDERDLAR
jgi:hypothetical protein